MLTVNPDAIDRSSLRGGVGNDITDLACGRIRRADKCTIDGVAADAATLGNVAVVGNDVSIDNARGRQAANVARESVDRTTDTGVTRLDVWRADVADVTVVRSNDRVDTRVGVVV